MLGHLAALQTKYIDGDHRLRPPTNVTPVDHHQIAFGHHHARLVRKVFGQFWDQILYRSRAARDCRIVLDIIRREILLHDTWVPIDERAGQCPEGNLLIGLHQNLLIYLSASECVELDYSSQARLGVKMRCGKCGGRDVAYRACRQEDAPGFAKSY